MLVLIAGITGKFGQRLAVAALERGLQVRGLGRTPENLGPELSGKFESFVTSSSYYDIAALEKAVTSVDAVICAYAPTPILDLEGQLLLLRAAERAGITLFVASSWNYNWSILDYGDHELYDTHIAFQQHVARTSPIRPVYFFTGMFADLLYTPYGPGMFTLTDDGAELQYWGDCNNNKISWSTMEDTAAYTIELLLNGDGVQEGRGGFFEIRSGANSIEEFAKIYEAVNGIKVNVVSKGSIADLEHAVISARKENSPNEWYKHMNLAFNLLAQTGKWELRNVLSLEHIRKPTPLDQFLQASKAEKFVPDIIT